MIRKRIFIKVRQKITQNKEAKNKQSKKNRKKKTKGKQIKSKIMFEKFSKATSKIKYLYNLSELERRF